MSATWAQGRKPLFPGKDYLHQLKLIIATVGTPAQEDLVSSFIPCLSRPFTTKAANLCMQAFISSPQARQYIQGLPFCPAVPFGDLYSTANPHAIELLQRMLEFNPDKRISVNDALEHPYLAPLHDSIEEPCCTRTFNDHFEVRFGRTMGD